MARATNIVMNLMSLFLVVVGLGLVGTFFFGSPVVSPSASSQSASSGPSEKTASPDAFNVPVISREEQTSAESHQSDPKNLVAPAPKDKSLKMTIPKMARINDRLIPYAAGDDEEALRNDAAIHLRGTGFPWEREANTYVAGHRLGYVNTGSFLAFFDLNKMEKGDEIHLTDTNGRTYDYRVYRVFIVDPTDTSVTRTVKGKNIVTLQTCTLPDYSKRLIVRAEKVS